VASLDELDEEDEPTVAAAKPTAPATSGGAIVPDPEENGDGDPVPGSEMAVAGASIPGETADSVADAEPADPYLVESGHILLDLISLEERTAADKLRAQGT